jgi:hypothetical protein
MRAGKITVATNTVVGWRWLGARRIRWVDGASTWLIHVFGRTFIVGETGT